jgi:hypothetical protein
MMGQTKTRLKGGSLSGTYLLVGEGGHKRVRKDISLLENREYGFVRWHSQLKRLQRCGELFPGVFPKVLEVGREDSHAYFDMEFIEESISGFEFLAGNPSEPEIRSYFNALVETMDRLHGVRRGSSPKALDLYLFEEMERPLHICGEDAGFRSFLHHPTLFFNGVEVPSVMVSLPALYELAARDYRNAWECYTHGNLTLENTLWVPAERRIWFIDPYEENIADTVYNEYSQVLQSSNSLYEVYNSLPPSVEGNRVRFALPPYPAIRRFNELFWEFLRERLTEAEIRIVKLYEISQFTRMLPFKLRVARDRMVSFYALASYLAHRLLEEAHGN